MKILYVFYDGECGLCRTCRQWLMNQRRYLNLQFIAFQTPEALQLFPTLQEYEPSRQLVVLSDEGGVYLGDEAWIMCLYALVDYRQWAQRMASPLLRPFAKQLCQAISTNRLFISKFL